MVNISARLLPTAFGQSIARLIGRTNLAMPVVVGATGGSGTRAVQQMLAEAGLYLGLAGDLNHAGDAMNFEPFLDRYINQILSHTRCLDYRLDDLPVAMAQEIGREFSRVLHCHLMTRPAAVWNWGWKNPRSMYLLPFIQAQFPTFRFIHVVRDGRDMAVSGNQNQYMKHYAAAFGAELPGDDNAIASFRLWCKANGDVARYGREVLGTRYLRVRLEDYVENPIVEITRILEFVGVKDIESTDLASLAHRPDSLGRWRRELTPDKAAKMQTVSAGVLDLFGYENATVKG